MTLPDDAGHIAIAVFVKSSEKILWNESGRLLRLPGLFMTISFHGTSGRD